MSNYFYNIPTPPPVLSEREQALLLKTTGQRVDGFRDHILFALALATGLREHELVALNMGDIYKPDGTVRRRFQLRVFKRSNSDLASQEVILSERIRVKLAKFHDWKRTRSEDLSPDAPLFVSKKGNRLSTRQVRHAFKVWQERAGFEKRYTFHVLRHSACTNHYRAHKDIRLTQRFARHRSILSTIRYTHPTDEEFIQSVQGLNC